MMREIANPTMLHDGSSWGGLSAMSAVIAAEAGFTGAPAVTIEALAATWPQLCDAVAGDNAPDVPNPGQRDDDGDGFGDISDMCRTIASPTNTARF